MSVISNYNHYKTYFRPCLVGVKVLVLSDSSMRAFARRRKTIPGHCIVAYGGAEILELITILKAGGLVKSMDLRQHVTRERILNGRDEIPTVRWCRLCKDECFDQFKGKILINIGLNNAIHAADVPYVQVNAENRMVSVQVRKS